MKKQYFLMAAFATAMAFTACSNEDEMPVVDNGSMSIESEGVIEIAIANGNADTRTARPVTSSAADNNVNRIKVVFLDESKQEVQGVTFTSAITTTAYSVTKDGVISYNPYEVDEDVWNAERKNHIASIKVDGLTAGTEYTVVAYGWNQEEKGAFPYGTPTKVADQSYYQTGNHTLEGLTLEEVFAGKADATASQVVTTTAADGTETKYIKFTSKVNVELRRQVAGLLAYLTNVPAEINGVPVDKVTVEANAKTTAFYFPASLYTDPELNGMSQTEQPTTLLTFKIPSGTKTKEVNGMSVYDIEGSILAEGITNVNTEEGGNIQLKDNTLYGGCYILPYASHVKSQTLVIKIWAGTTFTTKYVNTNQEPEVGDEWTKSAYDIRCNNFYSIGKKLASDTTDGPDPGTDDDDEPADLSASDDLTTFVNDSWDQLHNMELN